MINCLMTTTRHEYIDMDDTIDELTIDIYNETEELDQSQQQTH